MRILAAFLVVGALFAGGCEGTEELAQPDLSTRVRSVPEWPAHVLPIPEGLPREGVDAGHAFQAKQSDVWVVGTGRVTRILRDDTKPPRHQRFVVDLAGTTVLVAHNTDVAPRVPVKRGDLVAFRGEYIWSAQGGTVHWTHRDRRDRKAGGWVVWKEQTFR